MAYIEANVDELVGDLIPALREADGVFRECERSALQEGLHESLWYFAQYARTRDFEALERSFAALHGLWPRSRLFQSAFVRVFFGFEDLVAIRSGGLYSDPEDHLDALRLLRAALREALCSFADRIQERFVTWAARPDTPGTYTLPMVPGASSPAAPQPYHTEGPAEIEARLPSEEALVVAPDRCVGRDDELRQLWGRLRAMNDKDAVAHQVVGIKGPGGVGRTTLVERFLEHVSGQMDSAPTVIRARAPRLFALPRWPFARLLRDAFSAPLGVAGNAGRVTRALEAIGDALVTRAKFDRALLLEALPYLLRLMGEHADTGGIPGRTMGIRLRRAIVTFIEAMALRARLETGSPLFLVFHDATEMDGPSWDLLLHLLRNVRPAAPLMVLLTYDERGTVPNDVRRVPGFTEITLGAFDMSESDALIDVMLSPNRLDEQTRLRITVGAQGSPLVLYETVQQLVDEGIFAREGGTWIEACPLPDGGVGDLASVVSKRRARLGSTAAEVLEVVAVVEDTVGGAVLEEVAARRAIGRDELIAALLDLERAGLVRATTSELSIAAYTRHPLLHDEVYRQMGLDRRRAIHEDAGEVFLRLSGAQSFPSLAASHLALAGWPTRALHGLLEGIDRCVANHNLNGSLDLCSQGLGLLSGLEPADHDTFMFRIIRRREHIHALLGDDEARVADLERLATLAEAASPAERQALALRTATHAVQVGRHEQAEVALKGLSRSSPEGEAPWVRARLALAVSAWQRGRRAEASALISEVVDGAGAAVPPLLRARALYLEGLVCAADTNLPKALNRLFEAWRILREHGDVYGESMVVRSVADWYHTRGRLLDAERLLRRAGGLLREAQAPRARARVQLGLGHLHAAVGDFDEANALYDDVLRTVNKVVDRDVHAGAVIGRGRILVNRGQYDDAMSLLATCLKELGRKAVGDPVYVDALVALAMNFSMFARGEKLVVGGLRYAGEAKERAGKVNHVAGLVRALVIQVRGLVVLDRTDEAEAHLRELDGAMAAAIDTEPRMERLRSEVELCRYQFLKARGDSDAAQAALDSAWAELQAQLTALRGSGHERHFMSNIFQNREIVMAVGHDDDAGDSAMSMGG